MKEHDMSRRPSTPAARPLALVALLIAALGLAGCATRPGMGVNATEPAEAYARLGEAYLERNNLPRALSALDKALSLDPDDAEALQAMAMVYQRQGEARLADETFRRALDADPGLTRAHNNYAAFLYDQGRIREACEQLEQAADNRQYANRAQLFANLGQCRQQLGDIEAARDSYRRAQSIDPRRPRSYLLLAELEADQGNLARAQQQLDTYMRLAGPREPALRLALEIAQARGDLAAAAFYREQLDMPRGTP